MLLAGYERLKEPVASRSRFLRRLSSHGALALGMIGTSLAVGIAGYHCFEGLGWLDAFANAAMILSGMGPLEPLGEPAGKLFAGLYALYSGMVLIFVTGVLLAPILHRVLHRLHVPDEEDEASS